MVPAQIRVLWNPAAHRLPYQIAAMLFLELCLYWNTACFKEHCLF
jgi:hypothetical protein